MRGNVDLLSQNIMSRGGVEAGVLMIEVYKRLKQKELTSGEYTPDTFVDWREALADLGIDERIYFEEKSIDRPLPWEHIHSTHLKLASLLKTWEVFKNRRGIVLLD